MKKDTKLSIDETREYFQSQNYTEVEIRRAGRELSYFILPATLSPELPNFVFRCTGLPGDGEVFGISEDVDPRFRDYWVLHEYMEFVEIGMDVEGRCKQALDQELDIVKGRFNLSDFEHYVRQRRNFFRDLIVYCSKETDTYTPEDLQEFGKSLSELERVLSDF